jgi:hypothetical protein
MRRWTAGPARPRVPAPDAADAASSRDVGEPAGKPALPVSRATARRLRSRARASGRKVELSRCDLSPLSGYTSGRDRLVIHACAGARGPASRKRLCFAAMRPSADTALQDLIPVPCKPERDGVTALMRTPPVF